MRQKVIALVDCNNFYASCERAFRATLHNKPVAVLSNNDGCIVSISKEARALGLKRGQPFFQCQDTIERHNVQVFSSNYALYADMSARVMSLLKQFSPAVEIYSIDEAWLDLSDLAIDDFTDYGQVIKARVWQYTGLPVSVTVASTKCLAKVAMEVVKHNDSYHGVLDATNASSQELDKLLDQVGIEDVWGIGQKYALFLSNYGFQTAKHLRDADPKWIRRHLTVVGERIVLELRGISCIPLETVRPPKKGIVCAKTFGKDVTSLDELTEAVATYTARVAEKLREQDSLAASLTVFIRTNTFNQNIPQYSNSFTVSIPYPTAFTPELVRHAITGLQAMYKDGYRYKKAGVYLSQITPLDAVQPDLFGAYSLAQHVREARLMAIVDAINRVYGRDTLFLAVQGTTRAWAMQRRRLSPRYTSRWEEILTI